MGVMGAAYGANTIMFFRRIQVSMMSANPVVIDFFHLGAMPTVIASFSVNQHIFSGKRTAYCLTRCSSVLSIFSSLQLRRNGPGAFLEKGVVVHFGEVEESKTAEAVSCSAKVTMKYHTTAFSSDRYDEIIDQTKVFLTMDEASSGRGKRTRRETTSGQTQAQSSVVRKKVIIPAISSSESSQKKSSLDTIRPKAKRLKKSESPPKKDPVESKNTAARTVVNGHAVSISPIKVEKTVVPEIIKEHVEGGSNISVEGKMSKLSVQEVGVHLLAAHLYPSTGSESLNEMRTIDKYIKRGLLHALYYYLKPPTLGREDTAVALQKLHITVAQLSELLTVCPTEVAEMSNKELMPLCTCLLDVRAMSADDTNVFSSAGEGLLHVIKTYLSDRGFSSEAILEFKKVSRTSNGNNHFSNNHSHDDTEAISRLPQGLSIPLSYDHFSIALDLAFKKLKGRQAFENRKGVKGLEYVTNNNGTHCVTVLDYLADICISLYLVYFSDLDFIMFVLPFRYCGRSCCK